MAMENRTETSEQLLSSTVITEQPTPEASTFQCFSEVVSGQFKEVPEEQKPGWIAVPGPMPNCPPGLEPLSQVETLSIRGTHFSWNKPETTRWKQKMSYLILANLEKVFYAFDDSDAVCCNTQRDFVLHMVNSADQEAFRIQSANRCCDGGISCFRCCCGAVQQEATVLLPDGRPIGHLKEVSGCCTRKFLVYDGTNELQLTIEGPPSWSCKDQNYEVTSKCGTKVASVTQLYHSDDLFLEMNPGLDVEMKAALLAALLLIEFVKYGHPGSYASENCWCCYWYWSRSAGTRPDWCCGCCNGCGRTTTTYRHLVPELFCCDERA